MLFFGYFSCLIVAFAVVAMWLVGSFNYSTLPKQHHPRPPDRADSYTQRNRTLHLEVTKEASATKDDVSPAKHHKRKVLARQRNNNYGDGNVRDYAQETQYGPKRLFSNW